jgi:hypothetical protein
MDRIINDGNCVIPAKQRNTNASLEDKIERAEAQDLSEWDSRVLEIDDSTADAVLTKVSLIAEYNIFLAAWERYASTLSYAELHQLWVKGKELAAELLMPAGLVFPGSWRFELASLLNKFSHA